MSLEDVSMSKTQHCPGCEQSAREIERLREELAALRQGEPVAWMYERDDMVHPDRRLAAILSPRKWLRVVEHWNEIPLYTHSIPLNYQLVPNPINIAGTKTDMIAEKETYKQPPCLECETMTTEKAGMKCICNDDKDNCQK